MATQPIAEPLISVEEYLNSDYEPDCEFNNGIIEERNLGEFDHSFVQGMLVTFFNSRMAAWQVFCLPEQRVRINPGRYLIPDVAVLPLAMHREPVLTRPPLIAIEILSRKDTLKEAEKKALEYVNFGVENVWVIEPGGKKARAAYVAARAESGMRLELVPTGQLAVPGTPILVPLREIFDQLDQF